MLLLIAITSTIFASQEIYVDIPMIAPADAIQPDDPNAGGIPSERLRKLYFEAVVDYRKSLHIHLDRMVEITRSYQDPRTTPPEIQREYRELQADRGLKLEATRSAGKFEAEKPLVLREASWALEQSPIDWETYRTALWVMKFGLIADPTTVPILEAALLAPRAEKITDAHGHSIRDTIVYLGETNTAEAADLLEKCVDLEFWGADPLHSSVIGGTTSRRSIDYVRGAALTALASMDAELSLPVLERLAQKYTDTSRGPWSDDEYRFEFGRGTVISRLIDTVNSRNETTSRNTR